MLSMRYLGRFVLTAALLLVARAARAQTEMSGEAQAFITDSSARFVFPLDKTKSYSWDVPLKGAFGGEAEYVWEVRWKQGPAAVPGRDPFMLWLLTRRKPGGPRKGKLSDLIRPYSLDPMIDCLSCDGAVYVDVQRDMMKVFASVERGRLVFNVRGRDQLRRIFPSIPDTVTFSRSVRHTETGSSPTGESEYQVVRVNCVASARDRRSCKIKPAIVKRPPDADSAAAENAPRRVYVPVIRFQNATLMKHISVRVKTVYGKTWKVLSTGALGGALLEQPPIGPLLLEALCPSRAGQKPTISGAAFVQVSPRSDTSVHLFADPTVCPP